MTSKRLIIALLLLAAALYTRLLAEPAADTARPSATVTPRVAPDGTVRVARVIDGDTIELDGGIRVRYIGVNAPESVHPRKAVECFGAEASGHNKALLSGGVVRLTKDISDTDTYGRLLRYVYLPDGTFVNLALVRDGYAYASTYPPDVAHAADFQAAQHEAQEAGRGLWGSCPDAEYP